jgi:hypothetical protein
MKWICVIALLLLASCKEAAQVHQEWLGASPAALEFGAPFELELRRSWPAGWQAEAWSLASLAPFEAELLEESRSASSGRAEVRRKLRLRVHALGEQQLKLSFSALDPVDGKRVAASDLKLSYAVHSSLPQGDAGLAEFPEALAAPRSANLARRRGALALVVILLGIFAARAWWRRRRATPQAVRARADLWARFRAVQEMPRSTESQGHAALQAARALVRKLEASQAWAAPELAQRLAQRLALPRTEAASLLHFLHETEAAVFADQQEALPALDLALDELAEVLRAVDPEKVL